MLVVSIACCPGWTANVDGSAAELMCADGAFVAVRLAPGKHTVQLMYRPTTVRLGAFLSLLCAAVLAGLTVYPRQLSNLERQ